MISEYLVAGFGILVAVMPFLGFPGSWKKVFFFLIGASIFYLAFRIKRRNPGAPKPHAPHKKASTFADNQPPIQQAPVDAASPVAETKKSVRRIHPVKEELPIIPSDTTAPSS
ncbi:MAG: hypothetical protein AAB587_00745 [Patescibacteria group bacterium]